MRAAILEAKKRNENEVGREDKSPCSKVENIEDIMVKKLELRIQEIQKNS